MNETDWDGGWEAHERRQHEAWLQTTPAQRLAWLEQAIAFAHKVGALPRDEDPREAPGEIGGP